MTEASVNEMKPKSKSPVLKGVIGVFVVLGFLRLGGMVASHMTAAQADATTRVVAREGAKQAFLHATAAARTVEIYFKEHSNYPVSLSAADFDRPLPESVQSIRVAADGTLRVVLMGTGPQEKRSFRLHPEINSAGSFSWTCQPEETPPQLLPSECPRI